MIFSSPTSFPVETQSRRNVETQDLASLLNARNLGVQDYLSCWHAMSEFTNQRGPDTEDQLWLVEHPPVFTQGQAGKEEHLLAPGDIPVVKTDRGGQVTYHGPGQLVAYLLLDLRRKQLGPRDLVIALEQVITHLLSIYGINSVTQPKAPGVYVDGAKIASIGLRIRRGCSFHGVSINVDMDLSPFERINPCGYAGLSMTQMKNHLTQMPSMMELQQAFVQEFARRLNYEKVKASYV
jgi:lipoyl(octanoyl) transferase